MFITDDFVYIHYPKTGGTFVTDVLKQLYRRKSKSRFLNKVIPRRAHKRVKTGGGWNPFHVGYFETNKHGTCDEIPPEHRHKPVVSNIRSPYSRYVSHYEFAYWKDHVEEEFTPLKLDEIREQFPHFPDLTFEEYVDLWNNIWLPRKTSTIYSSTLDQIGIETFEFVRFFFKNPDPILVEMHENYNRFIEAKTYLSDMFDVHFLRTHNLNEDLYNLMSHFGWKTSDIEFVLYMDRICPEEPDRKEKIPWETYYSDKLKHSVRTKERFLFDLFPDMATWQESQSRHHGA